MSWNPQVVPSLPAGLLVSGGQMAALLNALQVAVTPPTMIATVFAPNSLSITSGTDTAVLWDVEEEPSGGAHSITTNPDRYTAPLGGVYAISAKYQFSTSSGGTYRQVKICVNGTVVVRAMQPPQPSYQTDVEVYTEKRLAVGDYIQVKVRQDTGGNLTGDSGSDGGPRWTVRYARA